MSLLKDCPFLTVENEPTDENPFAETKIRLATKEEMVERFEALLKDEEFIKLLEMLAEDMEE